MTGPEAHDTPEESNFEAQIASFDAAGIEFAYQEAKRMFDVQLGQADALDSKAAATVGFAGVAVSIMASGWLSPGVQHANSLNIILAAVACVSLLLAVLVGLRSLRVGEFKQVPTVESLWDTYLTWKPKNTQYHLLQMEVDLYKRNRDLVNRKAGQVQWAQGYLFVGILFLVCDVLVTAGVVPSLLDLVQKAIGALP